MQTDSVGQMYSASGLFHSQRRIDDVFGWIGYSRGPLLPASPPEGASLAAGESRHNFGSGLCNDPRAWSALRRSWLIATDICIMYACWPLESRTRLRSCVSQR